MLLKARKLLVKPLILALFYGALFLVNILPDFCNQQLGKLLGRMALWLGLRKEVARGNLRQALGDEYSPAELERILKKYYLHLGQVIIEFFLQRKFKKQALTDFFDLSELKKLEELKNREEGVIIYSAHLGNWEWLASLLAQKNFFLTAIAKSQSEDIFTDLINKFREELGINIIDRKAGVRKAYRTLQKKESLYILGDQHASHGVIMDFFSQPASVHRGAVRLSARTGAIIVPVFLVRQGFASYKLKVEDSFKVPKDLDQEEEKIWLKKLLNITESYIRAHPSQWTWTHRRWKVDA